MSADEPGLFDRLEEMSESELDELEFGIVRMDIAGTVTAYNRFESELAGIHKDRVVGKHFFTEVAPCTNNYMVAQKYQDSESLDELLDYVFTLRMRPTPVMLRLLKSKSSESQYLVVFRS